MEIRGTVIGLTPKETSTSKLIELKVAILFDSSILGSLAEYFGQRVTMEIDGEQREIDFQRGAEGRV